MATHISIQNRGGLFVVRSPSKGPGDHATTAAFRDPDAAEAHAEAEARAHEAAGAMDVERDWLQGSWRSPSSNTALAISGADELSRKYGPMAIGVASLGILGVLGYFGYRAHKRGKEKEPELTSEKPGAMFAEEQTYEMKDRNGLPWAMRGTFARVSSTGAPLYNWKYRYTGDPGVYPADSAKWNELSYNTTVESAKSSVKRQIDEDVVSYVKTAEGKVFG